MFTAKFKVGVAESIVYFNDWMKEVTVYGTTLENNETFFLIKPLCILDNKEWIWLNSRLFE